MREAPSRFEKEPLALVAGAVLVFIVFGIPVSGGPANLASFGPAFLRVLDPVLPLGVAASVVRNVVYFGGHATGLHLWFLTAWALAGVAGRRAASCPGRSWTHAA
jgi:hypothetical protein